MNLETNTGSVQAAVWTTAYVDSLPSSSFAFVTDDGKTRKLPYKNKDGKVDLPHVRNALARLDQTQGIPDNEKASIRTKLQNALKNTKASDSDDMVFRSLSHEIQADATTGELPERVHLLREGIFNTQKYGKVPVTANDIRDMVKNYDQGVGMPNDGPTTGIPVDFSHRSGERAGAWIHGLEATQAEDGTLDLWGTKMEWSTAGKEEVLGKNFKYISADFYPAAFGEWVDPESGVVATSVMVGAGFTNRPMFTGNRAVMASEVENPEEAEATGVKTVIYVNASETIKEKRMNFDQDRLKELKDLTPEQAINLALHASEMSDEERKRFGLEAAAPVVKEEPKVVKAAEVTGEEGTVAIQASELKALNDKASMQATELQAQTDKVKGLEASVGELQAAAQKSHEKEVDQFVDSQIDAGKIVADQKDKWVKSILADAGSRELLEALPASTMVKKVGSGNSDPAVSASASEEQVKKAKELMASDASIAQKGIQAAMAKVAEQDPELAQRVLDERRAHVGITAAAV